MRKKTEKKKCILLLNPPFREPIIRDNYCCFTAKSGYVWPPVDLLYLSGTLHDQNLTQIHVIDAVIEKLTWYETEKKIAKLNPDIIISLTGTASYQEDLRGLKGIVRKERCQIYLVGNTPAFEPEYFLETYPFVSGILHNFLDSAVKDFLLERSKACKSISFRIGKEVKRGSINVFKNNEEIRTRHVPRYDLFPILKYTTPLMVKRPMMTVLTSFGCPFRCSFCVASSLQFQMRNLADIKKEFDAIKEAGIKEIFFEDSTFNNAHMKKVCELLINHRYRFSWSANIHNFNASVEVLRFMKRAGCHTVQLGIESGSPNLLRKHAPSKEVEKIKTVVQNCRKAGLKILGYFIIGFPEETPVMAQKTLQFAEELDPDYASFSILTPDYGTDIRRSAISKKMVKAKGITSFDSSGNGVLQNKYFSIEEQERMISLAYRRFYLHPKRLFRYVKDIKRFPLYVKNGISLLMKKII